MAQPDFDKRETQEARILGLLRARGAKGATSEELNAIAFRYSPIIHTLRHKRGVDIITEDRTGTELKRYFIKPVVQDAPPVDLKDGCKGHGLEEVRYYGKACPACNPNPAWAKGSSPKPAPASQPKPQVAQTKLF